MDNLQFQDFNLGHGESSSGSADTEFRPVGNIGGKLYPSVGRESAEGKEGAAKKNFFSFEYYQQFFDVDTEQVYSRILNSMVPRFGSNFIANYVQPLPDLYGPFWICVTLVFTTAICGNLAKYIQTSGNINESYGSDFRLVTGASMLIACYVILVPFALYSLFWYRKSELQYSYLEIFCAYGYGLSIFVPVSVLWVINLQWFRWLLIIISVMLSGAVLTGSIWPALKTDRNRLISFGTIFGVLLLHCLLAIAFKEFYFDVSQATRPLSRGPGDAALVANIEQGAKIEDVTSEIAPRTPEVVLPSKGSEVGKENKEKDDGAKEKKAGKEAVSKRSDALPAAADSPSVSLPSFNDTSTVEMNNVSKSSR